MGTGSIGLTQVQCGEDDNHILRCNVMGIGTITDTTCDHTEDVAISCCKYYNLCLTPKVTIYQCAIIYAYIRTHITHTLTHMHAVTHAHVCTHTHTHTHTHT